ncbi:MAG TPA: hypothetical protein PKK85_08370 [Methanobacteriaceae archaeon]|nr:hypothetical protein [Methanobacteriaceae archaeon]
MAEVGYIRPENFQDIQKYHDRLIKRWRHNGIVHKRPLYGDWVVLK